MTKLKNNARQNAPDCPFCGFFRGDQSNTISSTSESSNLWKKSLTDQAEREKRVFSTQRGLSLFVLIKHSIRRMIVNDMDSIVAQIRFDGWKWSKAGVWEVKKALRQLLMKSKLHKESEMFDKSFAYIRHYY